METTGPDFDYFLAAHGMSRAYFDAAMEQITEACQRQADERRLQYRLARSGPNKVERKIGHAYRIKPKLLGVGPPSLAIDGHAYRRRQKNRVKRRRR